MIFESKITQILVFSLRSNRSMINETFQVEPAVKKFFQLSWETFQSNDQNACVLVSNCWMNVEWSRVILNLAKWSCGWQSQKRPHKAMKHKTNDHIIIPQLRTAIIQHIIAIKRQYMRHLNKSNQFFTIKMLPETHLLCKDNVFWLLWMYN